MTVARLAAGDLAGLDALEVEALALPLFELKAQPRAVAGYVDWRLCGRIARLLAAGKFAGAPDEALLMPSMGRVGAERIFLLGLGRPTEAAQVGFEAAVRVLQDAQARKLAFGAPLTTEGEGDPVAHRVVVERFLAAVGAGGGFDEVVVLDPQGDLRAEVSSLAKSAKKAGLSWEA